MVDLEGAPVEVIEVVQGIKKVSVVNILLIHLFINHVRIQRKDLCHQI